MVKEPYIITRGTFTGWFKGQPFIGNEGLMALSFFKKSSPKLNIVFGHKETLDELEEVLKSYGIHM